MKKNSARVAALTATLAAALLVPAAAASASTGAPFVRQLDQKSVNGGDEGFGNCGRNASGGRDADFLPMAGSAGNGFGGHKPGEECVSVTTYLGGVHSGGSF